MNILFLGSFIPAEYEFEFKEVSAAANQYQYNLYTALNQKHDIKVLSYIAAPNVFFKRDDLDLIESRGIQLFLPKVNGVCESLRFRKELNILLDWADYVISYNVLYPWFFLGDTAKRKKVKSCLILADYTPVIEEGKIGKKIYSFLQKKTFNTFDKVIALSKGSSKYIDDYKKVTVINGCIKWKNFMHMKFKDNSNDKYYILYTGRISKITGVDILIEAFYELKDIPARLVICGQGDELDSMIEHYVKMDDRIEYRGYLSKAEYFEALEGADLLVNPRNMRYLQNQNNFPSKVLEYLATGKPIVSTKFMDFEDYIDKMFFVESDKESIKEGILCSMKMDEEYRKDIFERNRKFSKKLDWSEAVALFI